jgi:multidrug transporter EmrE-like cation transporter
MSSSLAWLSLVVAMLSSLSGQLLLKAGAVGSVSASGGFLDQVLRWQTIVGLGLYGSAALFYIVALRKIPMSVALPTTAASYAVIALLGWWIYGEAMGMQKIAAIALICAGVALLATTTA